jgi:hypothetical protein
MMRTAVRRFYPRSLHHEGLFDKKFLPSGAPANDERVKNVSAIRAPAACPPSARCYDSQIDSIIAYLKTQ